MAADLFDINAPAQQRFGAGRRAIDVRHHIHDRKSDFFYSSTEAALDLKPSFGNAHAAALYDAAPTARAAEVRFRLKEWDRTPPDRAVYVIGVSGDVVNKIGISTNPSLRRQQLSQANPGIVIKALLWVYGELPTLRVERQAHRLAKRADLHVEGEWFMADVPTCCALLIEAARGIDADVADSKTALHNWRQRATSYRQEAERRLPAMSSITTPWHKSARVG